ncbi:hypothetical protein OH687_12680 [Burkholderia anthina]|nr:hypothetical protein OH687_12680 [Burkholderia anthina]
MVYVPTCPFGPMASPALYRKSDRKIAKKPLPGMSSDCQGAVFFLLKQRRRSCAEMVGRIVATQQSRAW